jgi:DNA-binding beta-propeller fold protein YncE
MKRERWGGRSRGVAGVLAVMLTAGTSWMSPAQAATTWNITDVFAATGGGKYNVYTNTGAFKETIDQGLGGFTTGCIFNPSGEQLYTTNFSSGAVVVFNDAEPHAVLPTISSGDTNPESIVFDASGNFYVGHAGGGHTIRKFSNTGVPLATYSPAVEDRGTDWIDLAVNQCTMFYTSEGFLVKRF